MLARKSYGFYGTRMFVFVGFAVLTAAVAKFFLLGYHAVNFVKS
jgi:hypothetical protein